MGTTLAVIAAILVALSLIASAFSNASRGIKDVKSVFLPGKFASLGNMNGKNRAKIIAVVGEPTHISRIGDSHVLLQWITKTYHIGLLFEGERFVKINNESMSNP